MQCDVDMPDFRKNVVPISMAKRDRARHLNEFVPKGAEVMPKFRESALHIDLGNRLEGLGNAMRKPWEVWIKIDSLPNQEVQIGK